MKHRQQKKSNFSSDAIYPLNDSNTTYYLNDIYFIAIYLEDYILCSMERYLFLLSFLTADCRGGQTANRDKTAQRVDFRFDFNSFSKARG